MRGAERLNEYKGRGKLDALLVYAIPAPCVQQAPGGRDNAKVVGKRDFHDMSLPDPSGNYFLSPAFIVGAFLVDPKKQMAMGATSEIMARGEAAADVGTQRKLKAWEKKMGNLAESMNAAVLHAAVDALAKATPGDAAEEFMRVIDI